MAQLSETWDLAVAPTLTASLDDDQQNRAALRAFARRNGRRLDVLGFAGPARYSDGGGLRWELGASFLWRH